VLTVASTTVSLNVSYDDEMIYHGLILFISLGGEALGTIEVLGNGMSWMDLLHICKIGNMW